MVLARTLNDQERFIRLETSRGDAPSTRNRLFRYGPVVLWAALIFIGSGNILSGSHTSVFLIRPLEWLFPNARPETLALIHLLIRKAGHLSEYAVLALLAARACKASSQAFLRTRWFWVSLIFVAAYALSDEFHQSFVPSRGASLHDSMIDTVGGLIGLALFWLWHRRPKKKKGSRAGVSKATAAA